MYHPVEMRRSAAPAVSSFRIEEFLGADVTDEPANVSPSRSPYCPNMIRESKGKVRKRTGAHTVKQYPERINGIYLYRHAGKLRRLIHAGTKLYLEGEPDTLIYSEMNDTRAAAVQFSGKLYIADGKRLLMYGNFGVKAADGTTPELWEVRPVDGAAYVPTVIVSRDPGGGGTAKDPVNLLGKKRTEQFYATAGDKVYQLSANKLDADPVTAKKLNASGGYDTLTETTNFTVDRTTGKVTFMVAPGVSPVTGVDNLFITYSKTVEGYADRINRCGIMAVYGVNGAKDRIFLSGNENFPNQDYYSQKDDPSYFGDLWYTTLGQDSSAVVGYSEVNNMLAAHKDDTENGETVILRRGVLVDNKVAFERVGAYSGEGAVSRYAFGMMETEPLFLGKNGVMAITPSDMAFGERYVQLRSYYLQKALKGIDLRQAAAIVHDGFYFLSAGGDTYVLDGTQLAVEKNTPFSYRQYEAYFWPGIDARVWFERDGNLCYGTADGKLMEFYDDYGENVSFSDDGKPIYAAWKTPEFSGKEFYNRKDFQKIAVLLGSAVATGCRIWALYDGQKELLRDYDGTARYFSFRYLQFSKVSFKTDRSPQELIEKIKIKKVKKISFLFENDLLNEPFGLYMATTEFIESR